MSLWPNDKVGDHRDSWGLSLSGALSVPCMLGCLMTRERASECLQAMNNIPSEFCGLFCWTQRVRLDERPLISKCVSSQRTSSLAFSWTQTDTASVFSAWQNNLETKLSEWRVKLSAGRLLLINATCINARFYDPNKATCCVLIFSDIEIFSKNSSDADSQQIYWSKVISNQFNSRSATSKVRNKKN